MSVSLLIAEPDPMLLVTLAQFFAAEGFYVQSVAGRESLRNRLSHHPPTVLLLEPELLDGDMLDGVPPVRTVVLTRHTGRVLSFPGCFNVVAEFSKPAALRDVAAALRGAAETDETAEG
jgi:DNA-binding response OmpR family regulator